MNRRNHWILPEGIEETLPDTARRMECLRRELLDLYAGWGYELVIPPFIDHIESLLTGTGHDLDLQTFKLVDQISGRTLGVRADMTPQVARIDAHHLRRNAPTRLCYIGTVLHTRPETIGDSRSPMQVGAELYGHAGPEAEVEVMGLMLQTFERVGVEDVYLDLGHVDIFRALASEAGLDTDTERRLFDMLQRKAVTEIGDLLDTLDLTPALRAMLGSLPELNGGIEVLAEARRQLADGGERVQAAIDYLQQVVDGLQARFGAQPVHIDLAELHGYHYKTGVVFAAFVPRLGQAIARGGRYDEIGKLFGRARPATGFSTDLKVLIRLSNRPAPGVEKIFAPAVDDARLAAAVARLRAQGKIVIEALPGQQGDARECGCSHRLVEQDGQWRAQALDDSLDDSQGDNLGD